MKSSDVRAAFADKGSSMKMSVRDGVFTVKKSYFYGIMSDGSSLRDSVLASMPNATIIDYGNHWHPFVGGAKSGSAKDSYLWVKFSVKD